MYKYFCHGQFTKKPYGESSKAVTKDTFQSGGTLCNIGLLIEIVFRNPEWIAPTLCFVKTFINDVLCFLELKASKSDHVPGALDNNHDFYQ